MAIAPDIHICEVAPRDGLQNLDLFVATEAKCALIDAIVAAGVCEIDAGSLSRPRSLPNSPTSTSSWRMRSRTRTRPLARHPPSRA
jgi:isopropylmalate/homocitrate/citramalate synthase